MSYQSLSWLTVSLNPTLLPVESGKMTKVITSPVTLQQYHQDSQILHTIQNKFCNYEQLSLPFTVFYICWSLCMIIVLDSVFNIHGFWLNNANLIQYYRKETNWHTPVTVKGALDTWVNTWLCNCNAATKSELPGSIYKGSFNLDYYHIKVTWILLPLNYYSDIGPEWSL